jgi:CDP-6-deoxy-D-xylo-4-hexulose-3-dehydrase
MSKNNWTFKHIDFSFQEKINISKFAFFNNMFDSSDYVEKFEKEFSEYTGTKHTLLVNSISSAKFLLFASLKEFAGLKDDDKILVPINGWSSNINAVIQNNLKPVFADVALQNLCIAEKDLIAIKKTYPDIKVIFTGHTLGFLSNTRSLREAFQYSIIIEDCCDALGLKDLQKIQVGSDSLGSVYNLQNSPLFPNNMGALICTNNYDLYSLLKMKRYLGLAKNSDKNSFQMLTNMFSNVDPGILSISDGYDFRSTNINAFLASMQLKNIDKNLLILNNNYREFLKIIKEFENVFYLTNKDDVSNSYGLPLIFRDKKTYVYLIKLLSEHNIEYRPLLYGNLLNQPYLSNYKLDYFKPIQKIPTIDELGILLPNNQKLHNNDFELLRSLIKEMMS